MATFMLEHLQSPFISKLPADKPMTEGLPFARVRIRKSSRPVKTVCVSSTNLLEFYSVDRDFPYHSLASKLSAGKQLTFQDKACTVKEPTEASFDGGDSWLLISGESICNFWPIIVEEGSFVVDNSSAFRMVETVSLGIPDVNPEAMSAIKAGMGEVVVIANPNCPTINCLTVLSPLFLHAKRGPGGVVTLAAADTSIGPVTGPPIHVIFILQHPSDVNVMKDTIVFLCQNGIRCQVIEFSTLEQCIKRLSDNGQCVFIVTDHGAGDFLDKIALCTSGIVIGVPMRASEVTGVPASLLGMSPVLPIMLVDANDAMGAARLALTICSLGHPEARILKEM